MATNWWEIGKPVQDFEPVAQEKKEQNWWEIGKPVEEPVVKPVAAPPAPESTGLRGFGEGVAATFENIIPTIGERFKQFGFGVTSRAVDRLPDSINIPPPGVPIEDIDRAGGVREYYAQVYGINSDEDLRKVKEESTRRTTARVEASQQRIAELTPEDLNLVQRGVRGGVESLAVMTPAVLASLATRSPVPGLAGAGALEGFGSYAEARAEGKDPNAALAYGGVNAAIEVATELIPGKRLLDALKVKDKGELKDVLLKFAAGEFLGEQAATAGQSLNALAAGLDQELANAKTPEEFARIQGERQAVTAISTIVAGGTQAAGIGAINKVREEVARRDIETQVRDLEEVGSDMERQRIDEIRTQALEDAQSIAAPKQNEIALDEGQAEPTPEQYGDNYAQKVYDSIGQYIPANAEFKVEQKTIDGVPRFVVTDKEGIQYGQTLDDRAKADSFALSLNNTTKSRAELLKQLEPLQSSLKDTLKGFGLNDMGLTLSDRIFTRRGEALTSEGLFDPVVRRVFLAVDAVDPQGTLDATQRREALRGVLRHEVVHALRYLDLWKRSEWKNLEKTVSKLKKPGTDKTYLQIAQENYGDQNKVVQVEEGVADLIRDVAGNLSKVAGKPRSLSERAINFFDKAKNAVTGAGFQTYEDIVQKFEQGDIGARQRGRIRTFRATEERQAEQGQLPERVQRLFTNPEQRNQFRQEVSQNLQTQVPATNQPALNSLRLNAVRESRSTIDPVPPKIRVDEQEVPTRDSEGRLIYSGYEGPEVFGIQTRPTQEGLQNFWRWFGKSKAADKDKRPLVYYHGTAADITEFRPKQAGSVFITRSPSFAKTFSDLSSEYMIDNFTDFMSNQEVLNVLNESMRSSTTPNFYDKLEAIQKKASTLIEKGEPLSSSLLSSIKDLYQESGVSSKMVESIRSRMPSNANIVPVYVKADNPFDYENKQHIKDVLKRINETSALELDSGQIEGLKKGDWTAVESPVILNAIKSLGFDSMYVEEMDEKNLAVFNPNQIKSAVGNTGDFSPITPSIRESRVRNPQLDTPEFQRFFKDSKAVDEAGEPQVFYHGTTGDIDSFRAMPGHKLIFASSDPNFASRYAAKNMLFTLPPKEMQDVEWAERQISNAQLYLNQPDRTRAPNVIPLYVSAKNPFDYKNKSHIAKLKKELPSFLAKSTPSREAYSSREIKDIVTGIEKGRWIYIEDVAENTDFFEKSGYDSVYVEEAGVRNLAVFNPNQLKSAVGNIGTFDIALPSIREARRKEPISPLQAIITPEEAEGRIRRRMEREPGVGAPRNERIEFTSPDGKRLVVGKITTQDWLDRVTQLLSMTEIQDARAWYRQLSDALRPIYGPDSSKWALAWLMSQKRASPTKGFTDVLRASDIARGKAKVKGAGLNEQALIDILQDKVPEGGIGAKLLDFLDSELGKVTRTVVRGDVRGRQPAAIDVWAQRDIGFIDETTLEFIRKVFGEQAANQLQVDKTTGGETQYEYGIDFYNNVAEMLNEANFDGGGWTAAEVQAVGWVTMQRAMGIQAEFVRDIIGGNTRRISIGLAPGANSILADKLAGKEIPPEVAQREIQTLADLAGIKVKQNVAGVGAYLQWVEGAIQIDAVASPEAVDDFMDMVGYVFQQTEVINTRSLPSGKNMAIDIMAPAFATVDGSTSFFSTFLNYSPKDKNGDPLAPGFQQINIDGMPGIRLLNFAGNWRQKQAQEILDAANKAASDLNIQLNNSLVSQVVLTSTKNDWSENKDGQAYLSSLRNRGRLQEVELLQRRYPPSRIDIQGDGSILWGERETAEDARLAGQAEAVTPRAREARPTRAGPTQPGPSTDRDDTSAADALNLGEPINSMGIATGPQITDTMPDGTVDISRARLEPLTKRLIRGVEFIQSAPDKLRGGVGLGDIAKRIEDYYDGYAAKLGLVNDIIRDAFNQIPRRNRESALNTFEQYIRARENNRTAEAQQIFASASPEDRQLISAWDQISRETGRINLSVTTPDGDPMKVWDSKVGAWRPIRAVQQFFPRTLRKEVMEVMKNPDLDPALWDSLLDSLVNAGRAESRQAAEDYLIREWFSDEIKQDYFAGVEKARSEPLPEVFYDYSWDAATRYLRKWARRTSQIENFGQELGQFKKDWFGINIPKVRDQETQNYLNAIRERIYEIESFDTLTNIANWANSLATATQLGNPISASLNLLGGTITNVQEFGIRQIAKSYIDLALDWKNVQKEGTTLGILNRDFMNILNDHVEMDADKYFSKEQKISQALAKFANATLTFGGFNGAENIVRASAMLAARSWLNDSLKAVNTNPTSARAKKFYTWINRENLDANALILENGAGPETDKYMRRAVNVPQGSYNIDMTPVFIDTPAGRFLLKYQKFGTQINRFFYRHFLKPFMDEPTPANFLRVAGFLGGAIVGGGAILAIREAFGYGDPGPDDEEIKKAFEKKDSERAWSLIFSRAWQNIMAAGSGGFFANYAQFAMDWQDQQRVKNPFSPPGLASVDAVIDVFNRMRDQGKLTARDLDEIAENVLSFYRANKRIGLATLEAVGADYREVKRFSAQKEIREVREYGRRYSEEMEIEFKRRTAPGAPIRTPMTPVNKAIADALAQGDSGRARLLYREAIRGLPPKEREKVRASVNASVRNRQPIQIGGNAPNKQERAAFLKWARQNLPAEKYQLILRTDRRYRLSAQRAGLGFSE